jgi:phage-related protein
VKGIEFPALAKREAGHQLDRIQHEGQYRVIYVASFEEIIYVLHAFQKKSRKTNRQDLERQNAHYKKY